MNTAVRGGPAFSAMNWLVMSSVYTQAATDSVELFGG